VSVPSSSATEVFDPGEIPFEVWDGEVVVKGQPSRWHEAVRAEVLYQLLGQLPREFVVLTSSAVGDDNTFAQSDGSLLAVGSPEGAPPVLWIEVFSESDLRRRDGRLTGRRRSWFLSQHSVATVAVFVEIYGTCGLHVFEDGRDPKSFSSPATAMLTLSYGGEEFPISFDLAAAADAGRRAEGE
jgi:hypothetical protein